MASETAAPDYITTSTTYEKAAELHDEVKKIEEEIASPHKEKGEKAEQKTENSQSVHTPLVESEVEVETKQVRPPITEEVKKKDEKEHSTEEDKTSTAIPVVQSEEKVEDKQNEPPSFEDVNKSDDESRKVDVPVKAHPEVVGEPTIKQETISIPEPTADNAAFEQPQKPVANNAAITKHVVKQEPENLEMETAKERPEDPLKVVDVTETSAEAMERKEDLIKDTVEEASEVLAVKDEEYSKTRDKKEEIPKPVPEVDEKPQEQSEVKGQIEKESGTLEPKESAVVDETPSFDASMNEWEITKSTPGQEVAAIPVPVTDDTNNKPASEDFGKQAQKESEIEPTEDKTDKPREIVEPIPEMEEKSQVVVPKEFDIDDMKLMKEEQINKEEPPAAENSDKVTSTNQEAEINPKEDGVHGIATVVDEGVSEDKDKESKEAAAAVVEELPKDEAVKSNIVEAEKVSEEKEQKKVVTEEVIQPETKEENVNSCISTGQVSEKSSEVENISRDIELVGENVKERAKEGIATSVEAIKDGKLVALTDKDTSNALTEPVEEPQKSKKELTEKTDFPNPERKNEKETNKAEKQESPNPESEKEKEADEAAKPDDPSTELEKEKEADEMTKPDISNQDSAKEVEDTKKSQDQPKEDVSAKCSQKHSTNIMAKVKQSLVKAKKAIIGKSSNSKTPSSETKGEVKVK